MTDQDISARLTPLFTKLLGCPAADVRPEATLVDTLGFDSLDTIELVMAVEEEFDIDLDDELVERFVTVQDVLVCIRNTLGLPE